MQSTFVAECRSNGICNADYFLFIESTAFHVETVNLTRWQETLIYLLPQMPGQGFKLTQTREVQHDGGSPSTHLLYVTVT